MTETVAKTAKTRFWRSPWFSLGLKIAVSAGLIYYLLAVQIDNLDAIGAAISSADPWLLLLAFSLNTVGYALSSWRWQILLAALGYAVRLIELARAYTIGIFFNSFLPGLMSGDFIRAMDISDRVPSYTHSLLIIFVERLTGLFGLLILGVIALPLIGWDIVSRTGMVWILLVFGCILGGCLLVFFSRPFRRIIERMSGLPVLRRAGGIIRKISETSELFSTRMGAVFKCFGISILFQANVVLHFYLIGLALGIDLPFYTFLAVIPVSLFVMMIPASVNGIGIREQIFIFLFGEFGVEPQVAVSLAWIALGMVLLQAVVGGILFALRKRRKPALAEPT